MNHDLKILPKHFNDVFLGLKKAEFRKNDRGFKEGDTVLLREWENDYTGRYLVAEISHVCDLRDYAEGFVMLSLKSPHAVCLMSNQSTMARPPL